MGKVASGVSQAKWNGLVGFSGNQETWSLKMMESLNLEVGGGKGACTHVCEHVCADYCEHACKLSSVHE